MLICKTGLHSFVVVVVALCLSAKMISTAVSIFAIRCARQAHVSLLALFLSIWSMAGIGPVLGQEIGKIAFIVGVSTYQKDGLANLQFAAKDATDLAEELRRQGFKVVILTGSSATKKAVEQKLEEFLKASSSMGKEDIVLISFSGHGKQREIIVGQGDKAESVETPFFCVYDTLVSDHSTMININSLLKEVERRSGTSNNLILVDACRNNPTKGSKEVSIDGSTVKQLPTKISMLFSSSPGMRSYESSKVQQGVFTHILLQGLRGEAANSRGEIEWLRLAAHVVSEVAREAPTLLDDDQAVQRPNLVSSSTSSPVIVKLNAVKPNNSKSPSVVPGPIEGKVAGEIRPANSLGMKMVWIPAGSFKMGSPESEAGHQVNENQVDVTLTKGFWMGQTEVTQGQYNGLMNAEPWKDQDYVKLGANYAASYVSSKDADDFVAKLNEREQQSGLLPSGWKYVLPTEAQWEYSCRTGSRTVTAYHFGNNESELGNYAWYEKNAWDIGQKYAHEVGQKKPNAWGLYDMHGNVWEWCRDSYQDKLSGGHDPFVARGSIRVYRGGGWYFAPLLCRSAFRNWNAPVNRYVILGFRVSLQSVR